MKSFIVMVFLVVVGFATGCNGGPKMIPVSADKFGERWPLTVTTGQVYRVDGSYSRISVVFVAPDGEEYGLNGTALTAGYRDIHDITKYRLEFGDRIYEDIYELINIGLSAKK